MSSVEYTKCDGEGCGRVTPDDHREGLFEQGWSSLSVYGGETYDLCPECTKKAMRAVGIEAEK